MVTAVGSAELKGSGHAEALPLAHVKLACTGSDTAPSVGRRVYWADTSTKEAGLDPTRPIHAQPEPLVRRQPLSATHGGLRGKAYVSCDRRDRGQLAVAGEARLMLKTARRPLLSARANPTEFIAEEWAPGETHLLIRLSHDRDGDLVTDAETSGVHTDNLPDHEASACRDGHTVCNKGSGGTERITTDPWSSSIRLFDCSWRATRRIEPD